MGVVGDGTKIDRVYFQHTAQLAAGPGSALIQEFLLATLGIRICLALIHRPDGKFTLVLDNEWVGLGVRIRDLDPSETLANDFEIPRQAMKAVIAGWPGDWDADASPTLSTHYSTDRIPHLSVNHSVAAPSVTPTDKPAARISNN